MGTRERIDLRVILGDPEMLARFERNVRGAGMPRRRFLAMASAVAGASTLAACGGSSSPTTTPAPTITPTKAAASAAPTTAAAAPPTAATPTTAPAAAAPATTAPTAAAATGPESKKLLIDVTSTEPNNNDINQDAYNNGRLEHIAGLLRYDQDFQILPDLAESYSSNGKVFTFKLRKGIAWSDGQPITAKDFVYSTRRMIDPRTGNGYASFWDGVRHVGSC